MLLAMCLAAAVAAQEPAVKLGPSPLELPARIGPLVANPEPHDYDQPGMGVSYQYNAPGASLTVYVYDAGIQGLADGPDTIPVCQEFEIAKQGVTQAYQQVRQLSESRAKLLPPDEAPAMREAVYEFAREGQTLVSYVWITAVAKQFIKLRFTANKQLQDELPDARRAILSAAGTAIKPHLAPVDAQAPKPGTRVNLNPDMMDGETASTALMYTMLLSALADDDPEVIPVCGGELVPTFDAELGLYRSQLVIDEAGGRTRLGKQIRKADADGFLEELVWTELHRDSWGDAPPAGLTLPEYARWKRKNLKRFQPLAAGSVIFDSPRPMPQELASPGP
jgi:hypothetical protein